MNAQWLFTVCSALRHNAVVLSCFGPQALVKLLSLWPHFAQWESRLRRENFTLSILPVSQVQFISLLVFLGSHWPCRLTTCDRDQSGQQTVPSCFSRQALSLLAWLSWALSQQLVVFIALGVTLVHCLWERHSLTLYGELIRQSEQNPGAPKAKLSARHNHQSTSKSNLSHTFVVL